MPDSVKHGLLPGVIAFQRFSCRTQWRTFNPGDHCGKPTACQFHHFAFVQSKDRRWHRKPGVSQGLHPGQFRSYGCRTLIPDPMQTQRREGASQNDLVNCILPVFDQLGVGGTPSLQRFLLVIHAGRLSKTSLNVSARTSASSRLKHIGGLIFKTLPPRPVRPISMPRLRMPSTT